MTNPKDALEWYERKARKEIRMDKIEAYLFMAKNLLKERTWQEGFTPDEYQELLRRVIGWCKSELKGTDYEKR